MKQKIPIFRFFRRGWGKPENIEKIVEFRKKISNRETCLKMVPLDYPVHITKKEQNSECTILTGNFVSPFELYLPNLMPKESCDAHFQAIIPKSWKSTRITDVNYKPMCLHLAGTGDHYFWRRRNLIVKPLLREANIGGIILENPFYGIRKPKSQLRSNLQYVSDVFVMGGALILESLVLLHWCERNGFGPLGITGISLGGHMASLACTNWPKPLVVVPCLSWSTAAAAYTQGILSRVICWDVLETQYNSDGNFHDRLSKMVSVVDDALLSGNKFGENYKLTLEALHNLDKTQNEYIPSNVDESPYIVALHDENISLKSNNKSDYKYLNKIIPFKLSHTAFNKINTNGKGFINVLENVLIKIFTQQFGPVKYQKIDTQKIKWWEHEALQFMRSVMDEMTHLKNYSIPFDPSLITIVCAKNDVFVPREGCSSLKDIWPGSEIRYLDSGHITAYILHQKLFRACIIETFEKAVAKYESKILNFDCEEKMKPEIKYRDLLEIYEKMKRS